MSYSTELKIFSDALRETLDLALERISDPLMEHASEVIRKSPGRLHFSGIGKPSYVAGYSASLFSSTGTPAYVLDGTEAIHGSVGQLEPEDIVVLISNSGETEELLKTANAARNIGAKLISVTRSKNSTLGEMADICLVSGAVSGEGGPLNRAPRASILAELVTLQALSIILQCKRGLSVDEYLMRHPGGSLGKRGHDD